MRLALVFCLSMLHVVATGGEGMALPTLLAQYAVHPDRIFRVTRDDAFDGRPPPLSNPRDDRLCRRVCVTCARHLGIRWSSLCWSECEHGGDAFDTCLAVLTMMR